MTILTDFLPWLKGWKLAYLPPTNYTILAGQNITVYDSRARNGGDIDGYILGTGGSSTNPLLTLEIYHVGPENQSRTILGTPFVLQASGLQYPNGSGFWHGAYAVGNYTAFFHPDSKIGYFNDYLRIRLISPAPLPSVVSGFYYNIIEVNNEQAWRSSLHKLLQSQVFHVRGLKT